MVMERAEQFVSKMFAKHLYLVTLFRLLCSGKHNWTLVQIAGEACTSSRPRRPMLYEAKLADFTDI